MNLEQEKRRNYIVSSDIKKIWAVEMQLLNKLLEVCDKYHLRVWAEGGTLLGTVREHGFIPWDDDIDMAMPREDYDKLRDIAQKEFLTPFFFQSGYTDLFPTGMTKLRMDGTAAIEKLLVFRNQHQGIFIDIFPLDSMPKNIEEKEWFVDKCAQLRRELALYCNPQFAFFHLRYNLKKIKNRLKIDSKGFTYFFEKYDKFVKQYSQKNSDEVSLVSWYYDERYLRKKSWYSETILLPFEDVMMPVPIGYDRILSTQYGDYMTPKEVPSMHDGFMYISTKKSYKDVLPELRKAIKKEQWRERKKQLFKVLRI